MLLFHLALISSSSQGVNVAKSPEVFRGPAFTLSCFACQHVLLTGCGAGSSFGAPFRKFGFYEIEGSSCYCFFLVSGTSAHTLMTAITPANTATSSPAYATRTAAST